MTDDRISDTDIQSIIIIGLSTEKGLSTAKFIFNSAVDSLSARSINVLRSYIYGLSSKQAIEKVIKTSSQDWLKCRNCGVKSMKELDQFVTKLQNQLLHPDISEIDDYLMNKSEPEEMSELFSSKDDRTRIKELEQILGHFPYFFAYHSLIEQILTPQERTIFERSISYRSGQSLLSLDQLAKKLSLPREKVRQLRNKLFLRLFFICQQLSLLRPNEKCPYSSFNDFARRESNRQEGTSFNLVFYRWIIGSVFDDYSFIGSPKDVVLGKTVDSLEIVPSHIASVFSFSDFDSTIDRLIKEKKDDNVAISLREIVLRQGQSYQDEDFQTIVDTCKTIVRNRYKLPIIRGNIIFKANTFKPLPELIYNLILEKGKPMTAKQLSTAISRKYPDRVFKKDGIGTNALRHPKVVSIGRTSTYTLVEWQTGARRGGSIRSIAQECINGQKTQIVNFDKVVRYIHRFRPKSDKSSIISNLIADNSGAFRFYYRNGIRYVAPASFECPKTFFPCEVDPRLVKSMSLYYPQLIKFIKDNKRFPFSSGYSETEKELGRFWERQEKYYKTGVLSGFAQEYHRGILKKYRRFIINKDDFEWQKNFDSYMKATETKDFSELDNKVRKWFVNNYLDYTAPESQMVSWKRQRFDELFKLMRKMANAE